MIDPGLILFFPQVYYVLVLEYIYLELYPDISGTFEILLFRNEVQNKSIKIKLFPSVHPEMTLCVCVCFSTTGV